MYKSKIFFLCFIFASVGTFAQNKLSYTLNKGETFKVLQSTTQNITQIISGEEHEITSQMDGYFTFIVTSVTDDLIVFSFRFDKLIMRSESNLAGELINIDTSLPIDEADIMGQIIKQVLDVKLQMQMYRNGKVKAVTGSEVLIDKMINAVPNIDADGRKEIKTAMANDFSNKSLADSFEQMTFIYPSKMVNEGDSWTNEFKGELSSKNTWTLKKISTNSVDISGEGIVTFMTINNGVSMNLTGTMQSYIKSDLTTGFIDEMTVTSTAKGNSTIKDMPSENIPTTIITKTIYKIDYAK